MNGTFSSLLLLLAVAVILVWLFRRIKLPAILAYLVAGIIAGPDVMGWIADPDDYHLVAELGIVLLLFSLGLEFSLPKMIAMRRWVFGLGAAQVLGSLLVFLLIAFIWLDEWAASLAIAGALALSSTAVVIKQLKESAQTSTRRGQMSVAILLFQDIAVVPLLIIIPLLASDDGNIGTTLLFALAKGAAVIAVLMTIGKWVLPYLFKEIAKQRTDELFVLATLLVALVAGGMTHIFGLSMALGAFLAGMMLGESQYKHQLEADIRPFRDILMGLFFTTIGMQLQLYGFVQNFHWILLALVIMAVIKIALISSVARFMGERDEDAWGSGISLFQMGEFGFVIVALASTHGLLSKEIVTSMIGIGVLSMAMTPIIIHRLKPLVNLVVRHPDPLVDIEKQRTTGSEGLENQVLICGFGRVGQTMSRFLDAEGITHIAVDNDPMRVQEAVAGGARVYFGDSARKDILRAVGAETVDLIIISFADDLRALDVLKELRQLNPDAYIIVRSKDDMRLTQLQEAGASQVVPDTLEASLMLISHVLNRSGIPIRRILARLDKERRNHYGEMHGFFQGSETDMDPELSDKLEFLKALTLPEGAWAIGKRIDELDWDKHQVQLKALRRDDEEFPEPDSDTELESQDVVLLMGKPRYVEAAERWLLEG
ncbi:MAG TPA: potassium transporter [Idiomarina abyssalis]|jgi:CPA2 family monovalent cation:H+ antiporter-2|uniref:monovalent cation:proton antiporter family protein n=3 Tax=Idiomarinaceae TaxID=267893 RepID=UPI000C47F841|nr:MULTISPECIES: monovalent cation:proton antiporter family protein [Idiomarina]MBE93297.1 potassium transporter [Idiomarina sp.]MBH95611.1 potassium transporter [Idiomarina sp.]QZN90090.1 cation:proton antiporter [Idiomarina abyssalis]HAS14292.1 potassium transporter [Idiomarina abyssalis]|tara:strand:- start:15756 stop:17723 length:1968 start_codon:yes stop_codon:yes gene_type:complete